MVLGAGLGNRLRPLTDTTPKPLIPVLGVPCIQYSLLNLLRYNIKEAVVNVHAHPAAMNQFLRANPVPGLGLGISDESALLLGSAGGIRKALPFFRGLPFFSLNADTVTLIDLRALEQRHAALVRENEVFMTLVLARGQTLASQTESYRELFADESSGLITGFGEKKNKTPFFTGTAIYDPRAFEHLPYDEPSEFVPDVLEYMIQEDKVGFMWMDDLWLDIGSPELLLTANEELLKRYQAHSLPESWQQEIEKRMR